MLFCSPFTITLDGTTVLGTADLLAALPKFDFAVEGEDLDFIEGEYKEPTDRGNQVNSVSFTLWRKFDDESAAAEALIDFQADTPKSGALVIDGTTYPKARMPSASAVGSDVDASYLIMTFNIIYGGAES